MNFLKVIRKKTNLTQDDIAYILKSKKESISRYEKGRRLPPLSVILLYHILFDVSLYSLFKLHYRKMHSQVLERSKSLIEFLQEDVSSPKVQERIAQLQNIVDNIGCLEEVYDKRKD